MGGGICGNTAFAPNFQGIAAKTGSILKRIATLLAGVAAVVCAACVPVPTHVYVADGAVGSLVYSECSLNSHVPAAVSLVQQEVHALVSLVQAGRGRYVEVRFDVPPGKTLALQGDGVRVDRRTSQPVLEARIPNVSRVDTPGINSYSDVPALRAQMLPVRAPLVGGRIEAGSRSSDRHYWIAARVDADGADDVWVTLPAVTVNDLAVVFPEVHFQHRLIVAVLVVNC